MKDVQIRFVILGPKGSYAEGTCRVFPTVHGDQILQLITRTGGPPIDPRTTLGMYHPDRDWLEEGDTVQFFVIDPQLVTHLPNRLEVVHV